MLHQRALGHPEVAVGMIRWDVPVVAPEQMYARPVDPAAPWSRRIRERCVHCVRCRSASQCDAGDASIREGLFDQSRQSLGGGIGERVSIDDAYSRHWRPSRSRSSAASSGPHDPAAY